MHATIFLAILLTAVNFLDWSPRRDGGFVAPIMFGLLLALGQVFLGETPASFRAWVVLLLACSGPWLAGVAFGPAGALLPASVRGCYVVTGSLIVGLSVGWIGRRLSALVELDGEELRLATLVILPVWCFRAYLTSDFFGGIDARSYAYGMMDALSQARAGVFPVLVGQSEFMFEGVIHPIRTAPYHHGLGILLDGLTWRALSPVAIQHLTVVVTAVVGTLSCYVCLSLLVPGRRWLAWIMAVIYISAPAVGGFVYVEEMYMTFMAFAWLPWLIFGNIWVIRKGDWTGWSVLAASLALIWLCHAPVGLWLTLGTAGIQLLRLVVDETGWTALRRACGGGLIFLALSAGYFWSVAEIAGASANPRSLNGRIPTQLSLVFAGIGVGLCLIPSLRGHRRSRLIATAAGLIMGGMLAVHFRSAGEGQEAFSIVQRLFPGNFEPVSASASKLEDLQLGYALLASWLIGIGAAFRKASREVRLLAIVGIMGMCLLVPIPGVTRFLLDQIPAVVVAISSVSVWLRYMPGLATLCVFIGFLGVAAWSESNARAGKILTAGFCLAAAWSMAENGKFVRSVYRARESTGEHLDLLRPENVTQFAYIFPGLPASPYLVNGVVDYHLESRLLERLDPTKQHGETVIWGDVHWQALTAIPDERNVDFLNLSPGFTLAPGEHRQLRFRFHDVAYQGVLVLRGPGGWYREYRLPDSGFGVKSFGVAAERPKSIALWNSGGKPQPVEMVFIRSGSAAQDRFPNGFADVAMQTYDPATLPIRTLGLIPYRAQTTLTQPEYLESPRAFIPGYKAKVNGVHRPVIASPNHRAMVELDAGTNQVEITYEGTKALWTAFGISGVAWLAFLSWLGWKLFRSNAARPQYGASSWRAES